MLGFIAHYNALPEWHYLPQVVQTLGVQTVLPASEEDYQVLLEYNGKPPALATWVFNNVI
ncbi:hypothetical protein C4J99_4434 [Pseudomonas synxantha]|nr:hypothetical protein C4J99_4434 [Pseudomonas synxantha]